MRIKKKAALAATLVATLASTAAFAQSFEDIQVPSKPMVLKSFGSFYIGGEAVEQSQTEVGGFSGRYPGGQITVNQMYVQFMVPDVKNLRIPVVLVHGGTLTGKVYETQPDGRMGWAEYFARKRFPVYIPDQVSRGRSGFDQKTYNKVRAGEVAPETQALMNRLSAEAAWTHFRFGPKFNNPYEDQKFPIEKLDEFGKQAVPDLNGTLASPQTPPALATLAEKLGGAVIVGHSQSGRYPIDTAIINNKTTKGMVVIEPGSCEGYTDEQLATIKTVPLLIMFGDHLKTRGQFIDWPAVYEGCKAFVRRVNAGGGNARMFFPPDEGIHGNSHMMMTDKNSDQIADRIIRWINKQVAQQD